VAEKHQLTLRKRAVKKMYRGKRWRQCDESTCCKSGEGKCYRM